MTRADGFTEEQVKSWCACSTAPDADGPEEQCPLHGGYVVEWVTGYLYQGKRALMGVEQSSDEKEEPQLLNALRDAEYELDSIRRYDRSHGGPATEYFLLYRLIGPWLPAKDA